MSRKELIVILFITFAVVLFWVISNILHDRSSATISPELQDALEPVTPTFDQSTLSKIKALSSQGASYTLPAPSPSPSPQPLEATPSSNGGSLTP